MGGEAVRVGQRQHRVAWSNPSKHQLVLRRRHLCRKRHKTDAKFGENKVQEDQHRQTVKFCDFRRKCLRVSSCRTVGIRNPLISLLSCSFTLVVLLTFIVQVIK